MRIPVVIVLAGTLCSASALLADSPLRPNPSVEAAAARELASLSHQLSSPNKGSETDNTLIGIATSLARLGRLDAALQTVKAIDTLNSDTPFSAPQTRDEVFRLTVRRQAVLGNLNGAAKLIPEFKTANLRADSLLALARAYLRRGEVETARKILFQVSSLVRGSSAASTYTAYLLCRSGELAAGKRLFARAQAEVPQKTNNPKEPFADWRIDSEREYVKRYLLKVGLVDEWSHFGGTKERFVSVDVLAALMAKKRFDLALELVRGDGVLWRTSNLVTIALGLDQRAGDRQGALDILSEAEKSFVASSALASKSDASNSKKAKQYFDVDAMFIGFGYRQLGDETKALKWEKEATTGLAPDRLASLKIQMSLIPLTFLQILNPLEPLPPSELAVANAQIESQLDLISDNSEGVGILRWLVDAQLKTKDYEAVRKNLPTFERFALAQLKGAKDLNLFSPALQVATTWRLVGDEARAQAVLLAIMEAPDTAKVTRRDRAQTFIINGFFKEGMDWLSRLPKHKNDQTFSPSIAYYEGKYNPNVFPKRILQIKEPQQKLAAINDFVKAIEEPIYNSSEEREFVYSQGYFSTSS